MTSYSFRRLGPTVADSCNLLWHERLPFGNWSASGLAVAERALARQARMPLLYADSSTKEEAEVAVKAAVWGLVGNLGLLVSASEGDLSWAQLTPRLKSSMEAWRQDNRIMEKLRDLVTSKAVERGASSSSSSGSSSSSSSSQSSSSSSSSSDDPPR